MSLQDDDLTASKPFGTGWRKRRGGKVSIDPHKDANKREVEPGKEGQQLYPEEIAHDTRDARITMTFGEPIKIRDQAEMVKAAMDEIIGITKKHDLGSIQQRRLARYTAEVLGRTLSRFNGRTPYGEWKKKP